MRLFGGKPSPVQRRSACAVGRPTRMAPAPSPGRNPLELACVRRRSCAFVGPARVSSHSKLSMPISRANGATQPRARRGSEPAHRRHSPCLTRPPRTAGRIRLGAYRRCLRAANRPGRWRAPDVRSRQRTRTAGFGPTRGAKFRRAFVQSHGREMNQPVAPSPRNLKRHFGPTIRSASPFKNAVSTGLDSLARIAAQHEGAQRPTPVTNPAAMMASGNSVMSLTSTRVDASRSRSAPATSLVFPTNSTCAIS